MIADYLKYYFTSKTAHGIHSPFVYDFVVQLIQSPHPYYVFNRLDEIRIQLLKNKTSFKHIELGAGSRKLRSDERIIGDVAKHGITNKKYSELLFRILVKYQCRNILELGTSLGLNSLYFCLANEKNRVISLEGNASLCRFAENLAKNESVTNLEIIEGNFNETLIVALGKMQKLDFVFLDGNHKKEPTLRYAEMIWPQLHENSIVVVDDIYWSKEMKEAWNTLRQNQKVTISIDLFQMGILFFISEKKSQEHFCIKY